jgi:hypothetical protein
MSSIIPIDPLSLDFGREKRFCVYLYRDPRKGKKREVIYVGKGTTKNRPRFHFSAYTKNWNLPFPNLLLKRVITKIHLAGLIPEVEFVGFFDEETEAFDLEINLIKRFGRRDLGLGSLCNLTDGGEGETGRKASQATLAKMRAAGKRGYSEDVRIRLDNSKRTPLARKNQSEAQRRRSPPSEQTRARISASKRGRAPQVSPDARARMSAATAESNHTRIWSSESRHKISVSSAGRIDSPETTLRRSAAQQRRRRGA